MKKLMLSLAAVGMLFTACSDDAPDQANVDQPGIVQGDSYIRIQINMPQEKVSRSANDKFEQGTEAEYIVKNATLLLFKAGAAITDPKNATFAGAYPISTDVQPDNIDDNQIDATINGAVKVLNNFSYAETDKIYALVVLNHNGNFELDNGGGLKINGTEIIKGTTTFESLSQNKIDILKLQSSTGGILMTNAVLAGKNVEGTDESIESSVLVNVTGHITNSEKDAIDKAVEIYVERAVAKVQMAATGGKTEGEISLAVDGKEATTVSYSIIGWKLVNKAPNEYLVRQFDDTWLEYATNLSTVTNKRRFYGTDPVYGSTYRTYFANTPFTFTDAGLSNPVNPDEEDFWRNFKTVGEATSIVYTTENTMSVDNMRVKNATVAIVKVKFTTSEGATAEKPHLYILNGYHDKVYNALGLAKFLGAKKGYTITHTNQVTFSEPDEKGIVTLTYTADGASVDLTGSYTISQYSGGLAYYEIPVKHFGDELTPWNGGETPSPSATLPSGETDPIYASYPKGENRNGNYLGRWGLVRNNWYHIEISEVHGLGLAYDPTDEIPDDPTPLDELHLYIKCNVNILSWAKRTQSEVLK